MRMPVSIAEKLVLLLKGDKIPFSQLRHEVVDLMVDNGILNVLLQGRRKKLIGISKKDLLAPFLFNHFGIENLENYIIGCRKAGLSRAEAIHISSNSKLKSIRTFKGFLVNCYQAVDCVLNNQPITIEPKEGTFTFIYDFEKVIVKSVNFNKKSHELTTSLSLVLPEVYTGELRTKWPWDL